MSEGQMIAQMLVGMPSAAMPVASPVTSLPVEGQETSAFAGFLRDMSKPVTTKPVVGAGAVKTLQTGNSDAMGVEPASEQADTLPDVMAMLLAMADTGKDVEPSSPVVDERGPEQPEKTVQQKVDDSQNVVLSMVGIQILPSQQINGRMPETVGASRLDASAMQSPVFAGILADSYNMPAPTIQQNAVASASVQQETPTTQAIVPSTTQLTADTTVTKNTTGQEAVRDVLRETPVTSIKVVSAPPEPARIFKAEPMNSPGDSVSKQSETTASLVRPALDTYFQTTVAPSGNGVADTASAGQVISPLPLADAVTGDTHLTLAGRIPVDGKRNDFQAVQETQSSKPDVADTVDGVESRTNDGNVAAVALKKMMASTNGGSFGQDGKGASDQKTGAQDSMMLLHQLKAESAPVAGTSGSSASEPVRTNAMEHVINQVREHLAGRDIKNGAEQVVIRLSPESLGELKVNLRMENQCLKVEIVAENNQVRDSLIKHSDILKETLARQNITMETFDVSTGGNRNGAASYGQNQSGWQELTQQQRNASWNTSGGYRVSDTPEIPQRPLYQASAEHSMVDVHF